MKVYAVQRVSDGQWADTCDCDGVGVKWTQYHYHAFMAVWSDTLRSWMTSSGVSPSEYIIRQISTVVLPPAEGSSDS